MTMRETEQSILADLDLLGDALNRMEYVLGCGRAASGLPPEMRGEDTLVADCQVNTWVVAAWKGDVLHLHTDSESMLVRGALSLIAEIYQGRSRDEVQNFDCSLLSCEAFTDLLDGNQKKGLRAVLSTLSGETP